MYRRAVSIQGIVSWKEAVGISISRDLLAATEGKLKGKGSNALQPVAIQLFLNHNKTKKQLPIKTILSPKEIH